MTQKEANQAYAETNTPSWVPIKGYTSKFDGLVYDIYPLVKNGVFSNNYKIIKI